ncbi:serine hydrolase domain-containing protein [Aquimarina sp. 2201CG1-2-11]|uniref:serine hydrolase domain-containing protein n=1 Tax=Aquimarina discodermiae TaxID=3231043 RepID=UPI00346384E4
MRKIFAIVTPTMLFVALILSFAATKQPTYNTAKKITIDTIAVSPEVHFTDSYRNRLAEAINAYFNEAMRKNQIVGAAVSIVKCDSVIYKKGYGRKNIALTNPVNDKTIFRIGSVSKGFASILAGIHVEEGLINWEDKVIDYIPNFELANKEQTQEITIAHILSHTTGLPYHSFTNLIEDGLPITTIAGRFKDLTSIGQPGSIYSYQNAVFALSGKIIEDVAGLPLQEIIQNRIFDPLHMSTASTSYEALQESNNIALPHKRVRRGWRPMRLNKKYFNDGIAAGGVNASITDMGKWLKFLLGNNPEVMMPNTMSDVFNPVIEVEGKGKYYQKWPGHFKSFYGLGWRVHSFTDEQAKEPRTVIHHGGSVNNYRSEIAIYSEDDLGICVLFNSPNKMARNCIPAIYKIINDVKKSMDLEGSSALVL